jgi:hypothetical protein
MSVERLQAIMEADRLRHPVPASIFITLLRPEYFYKVSDSIEMLEVKREIRDRCEENIKFHAMFIVLMLAILLAARWSMDVGYSKHGALLLILMLVSLFLFAFIYIPLFYRNATNRVVRKNDEKLKSIAQTMISEIRRYFKEKGIDPARYPLELRHNDYEGLRYEEKGKNKYIAYVVVG